MTLPGVLLCLIWPSCCVLASVLIGRKATRRAEQLTELAQLAAHDACQHATNIRDWLDQYNANRTETTQLRAVRPTGEQPHRLTMTRGERERAQGIAGKHHLRPRPRREP